MSEWNPPIPIHFSSLISKTLMFNLAIFCLTTSILPWFMDPTLKLPMQYFSLQHETLLSPPDTSTPEHHSLLWSCCFILTGATSVKNWPPFFPLAYQTPSDLGSSSSNIISICLFSQFRYTKYLWLWHYEIFFCSTAILYF